MNMDGQITGNIDLEDDDDQSRCASFKEAVSRTGTTTPHKPAELFRKDLISAMKLADTDQLNGEDYLLIQDPWRQDWERGVQVPVNASSIPSASFSLIEANKDLHQDPYGFKLKGKYLHAHNDETYHNGTHELHETHKLAEQVCRYDLDDLDVAWLTELNLSRIETGDEEISEFLMETVMEEIETQCYNNMQTMMKTVEGLGIEYDENVVCEVCRCPDSEDTNEMIFCDNCDICVHQACYGVQTIPEGSWLCRTCALGIKPTCILCPLTGGAMKSTKSGSKWAHVSCAIWIPEVSIGCPEKMEPIAKISQIPASRWSLICSICREKSGACVQCSVKACKTAFHVTCAFMNGLKMEQTLAPCGSDVLLKPYCAKHSKKKNDGDPSSTPTKDYRRAENSITSLLASPKKESEMTEAEKTELRSERLKKLKEELDSCVNAADVSEALSIPLETVDYIYAYWLLRRRSNFNKPLLTPKTEEEDLLSKQQEDSLIARTKMFIHLRQDLERVRNLCYMVVKREKMRKQCYRMKEDIFNKQNSVLTNSARLGKREMASVLNFPCSVPIYDNPDHIMRLAKKHENYMESGDVSLSYIVPSLSVTAEKLQFTRPSADVYRANKEQEKETIIACDSRYHDSDVESVPVKKQRCLTDFTKNVSSPQGSLHQSNKCNSSTTPNVPSKQFSKLTSPPLNSKHSLKLNSPSNSVASLKQTSSPNFHSPPVKPIGKQSDCSMQSSTQKHNRKSSITSVKSRQTVISKSLDRSLIGSQRSILPGQPVTPKSKEKKHPLSHNSDFLDNSPCIADTHSAAEYNYSDNSSSEQKRARITRNSLISSLEDKALKSPISADDSLHTLNNSLQSRLNGSEEVSKSLIVKESVKEKVYQSLRLANKHGTVPFVNSVCQLTSKPGYLKTVNSSHKSHLVHSNGFVPSSDNKSQRTRSRTTPQINSCVSSDTADSKLKPPNTQLPLKTLNSKERCSVSGPVSSQDKFRHLLPRSKVNNENMDVTDDTSWCSDISTDIDVDSVSISSNDSILKIKNNLTRPLTVQKRGRGRPRRFSLPAGISGRSPQSKKKSR